MEISLNKIIDALSFALDLSQASSTDNVQLMEKFSQMDNSKENFSHHSKRTAYISLEIGKKLNINNNSYYNLYISSMIHDIGAENALVKSHNSYHYVRNHCIEGATLIQKVPSLIQIYDIILYHHENYDGSGCMKLKHTLTPIESQIIRLADLIDVRMDESIPVYKQKDSIVQWVKEKSGTVFSPDIVECFLELSKAESFWLNIFNSPYMNFIFDYIAPKEHRFVSLEEFEHMAEIFANIIDTKSSFTATHSRGIANLTYDVCNYLKYSKEKCKQMKIAALLHDIGKLAIPSSILDKNGPLTCEEFSDIKSHPYYTKLILDKMGSLGHISDWAANHHEKLDGTGYPRSLKGEDISEESRIIGVCDIYQALTEDRPYRKGMLMCDAFNILYKMVSDGLIGKSEVEYLKETLVQLKS